MRLISQKSTFSYIGRTCVGRTKTIKAKSLRKKDTFRSTNEMQVDKLYDQWEPEYKRKTEILSEFEVFVPEKILEKSFPPGTSITHSNFKSSKA